MYVPLFWRLFIPNAVVLLGAGIVLTIQPANGRVLVLGAGLAVLLTVNLILMRRASLSHQVGQEDPHLGRDIPILTDRPGRFLILREGIGELQDHVAPTLVPRPLVRWDAEHLRDHLHGQRDGEACGQVHLAALARLLQKLA